MKSGPMLALAAILTLAFPGWSHAQLKDENLLLPLPKGFKVGFHVQRGGMMMTEFVPAGETVEDWSQIVTEQIFYGRGRQDPDALPQGVAARWPSDCPGGEGQRIKTTEENGYPVALWMFVCPRNPATGKPENMWMKVVAGADALYSVQYAYRRELSKDMIPPTMDYLRRVFVCDTRSSAHACPSGM